MAIAESTATARELLVSEAWALAESRETGVFGPLRAPAEVLGRRFRPQQVRRMEEWLGGTIHGDAERVAQEISALVDRTGADEVIASTSMYDRDALARSDEALAELPGRFSG